MTDLLTAVLAIFVGVAIVPLLQRQRLALAALDGFVVVAIGGLVLLTLLPYSLHHAGVPAAVAAGLGLLVPSWVERRRASSDGSGSATTLLALAGLGLSVHAFLDGAALASSALHDHGDDPHAHGEMLALAVVLHRLPMGLVLGLLARHSPRVPWLMALAVALATFAGYAVGNAALPSIGLQGLAMFQALVAGSLLHVVFAHTPTELAKSEGSTRLAGGLGALGGVALAVYVGMSHPITAHCHEEQPAGATLIGLAYTLAPAMLVALVIAGLLSAISRREQHLFLRDGSPWSRPIRGLISGLPLPISSCGILPIYRSLVEDRVPSSASLAFLLATPQLSVVALLVSWPAFGPGLTTLRVVCAVLASVAISLALRGWGIAKAAQEKVESHEGHHHPVSAPPTLVARLREGLRFGLADLSDHLLPWLAFGLILAALAEALIPEGQLLAQPSWLQVPFAAALALPLYLCATGSTPLLAVLLHKGLSPGAALAVLVTGPALNWETFILVKELHGRSRAWTLALTSYLTAVALGLAVDYWLASRVGEFLGGLAHQDAQPKALQQIALTGLLLLGLLSLLRSGARGWLGQLQARYGEHVHHAVDPHACAHDHGHAHAHDHSSEHTGDLAHEHPPE